MSYTITSTSEGIKVATSKGYRLLKFRKPTYDAIKSVIAKRKAVNPTGPVEQTNVVTPQVNPTPVVNIVNEPSVENRVTTVARELDIIAAKLDKMGANILATVSGETITVAGRIRPLKVGQATMKGIWRAKAKAPKALKQETVQPELSNVVSFPTRDVPKMESTSIDVASKTPEPREINITPFPAAQSEVSKPYGGAPIYGASTVVPNVEKPNINKEVVIPKTTISTASTGFSKNIESVKDINELERMVAELAKQTQELEEKLQIEIDIYNKAKAKAEERRKAYLQAQYVIYNESISQKRAKIEEIREAIENLKKDSSTADMGINENFRKAA